MTLGIIDVGTNSIHLLIGILGLNGRFHILHKERDLTRLGEGGLASSKLTAKAMRRAGEVLAKYAVLLRRFTVDHVEATATSAVREASNGLSFALRIRRKLKIPLRVISGREEARLIYLGVLQSERFMRSTMIVSFGGGSAEIMIGDHRRLYWAVCRPMGCARLAERFIKHDPARPEEIEALRNAVRAAWRPLFRQAKRHRWHQTLGSSATIQQVLTAAYLFSHRGKVKPPAAFWVSQRVLRQFVRWLSTSRAQERVEIPGLDPRRQDLALSTGIALLEWMEGCKIGKIRHAPGSLREGLVVDYLIRHHQKRSRQAFDSIADLIASNGSSASAAFQRPLMQRMQYLKGKAR